MSKWDKLLERVLRGTSDAGIPLMIYAGCLNVSDSREEPVAVIMCFGAKELWTGQTCNEAAVMQKLIKFAKYAT